MSIQPEPDKGLSEPDSETDLPTAPADEMSDKEPARRRGTPKAEDDAAGRTITVTRGCVFGAIAVMALCVVASGVGLWLLGQQRGIGPFGDLASSSPSTENAAQVPATTVATVNGEPITTQDLDNLVAVNIAMTTLQGGEQVNLTPQQRQQARLELLNQAIRNTLILQAARSVGMTVSEDRAQAEWFAWVRRSGLTPDQLDAELQQAGASREVFQEWLGNALLANQYLTQYVAQGSTQEERTQAYEQWLQQQLESAQIQVYQTTQN